MGSLRKSRISVLFYSYLSIAIFLALTLSAKVYASDNAYKKALSDVNVNNTNQYSGYWEFGESLQKNLRSSLKAPQDLNLEEFARYNKDLAEEIDKLNKLVSEKNLPTVSEPELGANSDSEAVSGEVVVTSNATDNTPSGSSTFSNNDTGPSLALSVIDDLEKIKYPNLFPENSLYLGFLEGCGVGEGSSAGFGGDSGKPYDYIRCDSEADEEEATSCLITHHYSSALLSVRSSNSHSVKPCPDENCLMVYLGDATDNSLKGNCSIFEENLELSIDDLSKVSAIVVENVYYDDYYRLFVSVNGSEDEMLLSLPNGLFPPLTDGKCELAKSNSINLHKDILATIRKLHAENPDAVHKGGGNEDRYGDSSNRARIKLTQKVSVTGAGEGYALVKIYFKDKFKYDNYFNLECLKSFKDAGADIQGKCLDMPKLNDDGCYEDGILLCPNDFTEPLVFSESNAPFMPLCRSMLFTVSSGSGDGGSSCPALSSYAYCIEDRENSGGYYCYKDKPCFKVDNLSCSKTISITPREYEREVSKNYECEISISDNGEVYDSCLEFQKRGCALTEEECLDDVCGLKTRTYSCPETTSYAKLVRTDNLSCPLSCLGTSCANAVKEEEADITEAFTYLEALNYLQDDITCGDNDILVKDDCRIFKGTPSTCRMGYFGKMDCCTSPADVGLSDYIKLTSYVMSLKSALTKVEVENIAYGSWSNPELLNSGQGLISSGIDSLLGSASEIPAENLTAAYSQELTAKVANYIGEFFGEGIKNELFTETTVEGGASVIELNSQVVFYAQTVLMAYVAYKVMDIALDMLTACRENELASSVKLGLNSCIYTGKRCTKKVLGKCLVYQKEYCCYNSTFARIFMSELQRTNQISNVCEGIKAGEFNKIDMSVIDLSEWTTLLQDAQILKKQEYTMEGLTGKGSELNTGFRENVKDRTINRLDSLTKER